MIPGVLILDKPAGVTSHDIVDRVRKVVGTRRVGHLGTLDPMATGVLPLVVGTATRLSQFFSTSPKEYLGTVRLGWETTTDDAEGDPIEAERRIDVGRTEIIEAMSALEGRILQTPPAFSAKKIRGVAAYRLARRGMPPDLRPVEVEIFEFKLTGFSFPTVEFTVRCSTGTYVRSLARDMGKKLGTGAHLSSLRRTRSGVFRIEDAVSPDEVSGANIIPPEQLLADSPSIFVDDAAEEKVRHGSPVTCPADSMGDDREPLCIFNKKGELIAIGVAEKGWARPKVVLI